MKKIFLIITLVLASIVAHGQYDMNVTPDTIPDGGSRQLLREAVNWNLIKNDSQDDPMGTSIQTDTINESTLSNGVLIDGVLNKDGNIIVPSNAKYIGFVNSNARIAGTGGLRMDFYANGNNSFRVAETSNLSYETLYSSPADANDLGITTSYWRNIYAQRWYVDDGNTSIYLNGTDLTFDDANNTPQTLTQLLGGGGSYLAGSGLTLVANTFHIGGTLTQNATLTTTDDYELKIQTTLAVLPRSAEISVDIGRIELASYDNATFLTTGDWGKITVADEQIKLWSYKGADASSFTVDGGGFDMASTTTTFIPPRMTTVQRTALTPVEGSFVYDTDIDAHFSYRNSAWGQIASGTPVVGGDILILKSDWQSFTFGLGNANAGDDALFVVGAELGSWRESRAISVPEEVNLFTEGTSGSVTIQIYYGTDPTAAGTALLTSDFNITTVMGLATVSSFTTATIPKGSYIWAEITATPSTDPTKIRIYYSFSFQ